MPKTPLNPSPLALHEHHFTRIDVRANTGEEFGPGALEVNRSARHHPDDGLKWIVDLEVSVTAGTDEGKPPPYEGLLHVRGFFEVHKNYPNDPTRLINITAASILYGAAREMFANLTARSSNGMVSLPSVSFFEAPEKAKPKKKSVKKAPAKARKKAGSR